MVQGVPHTGLLSTISGNFAVFDKNYIHCHDLHTICVIPHRRAWYVPSRLLTMVITKCYNLPRAKVLNMAH